LREFGNRVLVRIFGTRRKLQETGENCIMKSYTSPDIIKVIQSRNIR
jgi:hypothetical protein